ncbi:MAG: glycosyltransferase family 2 protein [Thermoplasmata archaeon]
MNESVELSVLMPAYNEESIIVNSIKTVSEILNNQKINYEIIVIDDGSSDHTYEKAKSLNYPNVIVAGYKKNAGKGRALKYGFNYASGKYVIFYDSDLEISPYLINEFLKAIKAKNVDIVVGSKWLENSKIEYPLMRKILSLSYHIMLKVLFQINIRDTQVGIKIFKKDSLGRIFPYVETIKYSTDIEILALASMFNFSVSEIPVEIKLDNKHSHIKLKNIAAMFIDTLQIFYRLKISNEIKKKLKS